MSRTEDLEMFWKAARDVSEAVGAVLVGNLDWAESGHRAGQYRVDLLSDIACSEILAAAGFAVLSEESGLTEMSANRGLVVLDPLDGSTNAARGVPWYATAMCLVDDGGASAAWVVNHATGDVFTAERGGGARCNGLSVSVTSGVCLNEAIVGISGLADHHYGWAQFRALGAAALDICGVASGMLDAWCDMSTDAHGVWDYLAAVVICTEAGGVAVDAFGRDLLALDPHERRTPVVAANPLLLEEILAERNRSAR
jgi:fructose-1,6-bisphosphatase/inositol monophosphatase family enzyme